MSSKHMILLLECSKLQAVSYRADQVASWNKMRTGRHAVMVVKTRCT